MTWLGESEMNGNSIRANLATTGALLMLVVVTMGVANRGETAEQTLDQVCESAVWPMIPAQCFGRYNNRDVYPETVAFEAAEVSFVVDQDSQPSAIGASGKADLLQSMEIDDTQYRTVETRGDGISVLRRVKAK
jgi:hypothetical protein